MTNVLVIHHNESQALEVLKEEGKTEAVGSPKEGAGSKWSIANTFQCRGIRLE